MVCGPNHDGSIEWSFREGQPLLTSTVGPKMGIMLNRPRADGTHGLWAPTSREIAPDVPTTARCNIRFLINSKPVFKQLEAHTGTGMLSWRRLTT